MKPGRLICTVAVLATAAFAAGCGSRGDEVASNDSTRAGSELFASHCSGCHTLDVAGTVGSATKVRDRERVDGPNFNTRCEKAEEVLYAIRNGGFSGAIMPENIVVGKDAQAIADFLAKYAGKQSPHPCANGSG